jgi:hypothetical protein
VRGETVVSRTLLLFAAICLPIFALGYLSERIRTERRYECLRRGGEPVDTGRNGSKVVCLRQETKRVDDGLGMGEGLGEPGMGAYYRSVTRCVEWGRALPETDSLESVGKP